MNEHRRPLPAEAEGLLRRLRRRQRWRSAFYWGTVGLLGGAIVATLLVAAVWLSDVTTAPSASLLWVLPAALLVGMVVGALFPVGDLRIARALDQAAASDDRFASAVQLVNHRRQARSALVLADALARVGRTPLVRALPLRAPRQLRWLPVPVVALAAMFLLSPMLAQPVAAEQAPEVTAEQWAEINDTLRQDLESLPEPLSEQERETRDELERLAKLLEEQPEKKTALAEIAKLRAKLESQQRQRPASSADLRKAAEALQQNKLTEQLAQQLRANQFDAAAGELQALAAQLEAGEMQLSAEEFEALEQSFEQAARALASNDALREACQNCSSACSRLSKDQLAQAMRNFSDTLRKLSDELRECSRCNRALSMLDKLQQRLAQCQSCQQGAPSNRFVLRNDRKGGSSAGWGTAAQWEGGSVKPSDEGRSPSLVDAREGPGASSASPTISVDERAASSQQYRELYAEMVQKAEADLGLEDVPLAYRDYLRRYFNAIKPTDTPPDEE